MRLIFLVNRLDELQPKMTTAMLIEAAAREGLEPRVAAVDGLWLDADGSISAKTHRPSGLPAARDDDGARVQWLMALASSQPEVWALEPGDRLWIRTNPARDAARAGSHRLALDLAGLAAERGVAVANDPRGLTLAASKLYLARLPEATVPRGIVAGEAERLREFVAAAEGPVVLKPLAGTRGAGVFRVQAGEPNLGSILESLLASGPVMAQDWLPGAEEGDLRVLLLDGRTLTAPGGWAAIRRRPAAGDFRSNLHAGGRAEPAEPTAEQQATLAAIAPRLVADGLRLVGVDLIGPRVIELNVFSTGGLRDAERFAAADFSRMVVRGLIEDPGSSAGPLEDAEA